MSSSIMIIGAAGRLGVALIRSASAHPSNPSVHAFVRTPSKIPAKEQALCRTVQKGDALNSQHVERALDATKPDTVIVTIGVPNSVAKSTLRENSANTLVSVIRSASRFQHIRVVCVSTIGAGGSKVILGFGIGLIVAHHFRNVFRDHSLQEEAFINGLGKNGDRLLIVRPTSLIDGKPGRKIVTFGDEEKAPSFTIDRADVAAFITEQTCGNGQMFGKAVNIGTAV